MGLYRNEKKVVEIFNDGFGHSYNESAKIIATKSNMNEEDAIAALNLAIDSEYITKPAQNKDGQYSESGMSQITAKGKRYLNRRFGVADQFIASYGSANNFIAILALVFSILALISSAWLRRP